MIIARSRTTRLKHFGLGAAGIALLTLLPTSSFSAPIGSAPIGDVSAAQTAPSVQKVEYRCWWSEGERHCDYFDEPPSYAPRVYGYYYGPYDEHRAGPKTPKSYWPGSESWWKSMERWGRAGTQ